MKSAFDIAHETFFYNKKGYLFWKIDRGSNKTKGKKFGSIAKNGYTTGMFNGKREYAHRIIFLMNYGYMPKLVDHINRDPKDNRIENLRETNHSLNMFNHVRKKGLKGVVYDKINKKWRVRITFKGKCLFHRRVETYEEAKKLVYLKSKELLGVNFETA